MYKPHASQLVAFVALALCSNLTMALAAEGESPRIGDVAVEVNPLIQGIGGVQTVKTSTQLSSTC